MLEDEAEASREMGTSQANRHPPQSLPLPLPATRPMVRASLHGTHWEVLSPQQERDSVSEKVPGLANGTSRKLDVSLEGT